MPSREIELALKRGRLQERIAVQRAQLAVDMRPIASTLAVADRAVNVGQAGVRYVRQHPVQVGIVFAALAVLRPRRVWRWTRRALVAWSAWRKIRMKLEASGFASGRSVT